MVNTTTAVIAKKKPPKSKPTDKGKGKGKSKGRKYIDEIDPNAAMMMKNVFDEDTGKKSKKPNLRLSADDYREAAGYLEDFKAKVKDKLIKVRLDELIDKFIARANKMDETKAGGATHQKTKAQKYLCKDCKEEFRQPKKKLHCPGCDSTNLEQLKITDFQTEEEELRAVTAQI